MLEKPDFIIHMFDYKFVKFVRSRRSILKLIDYSSDFKLIKNTLGVKKSSQELK